MFAILKTEAFEGDAYLLTEGGDIWRIHIDSDEQPCMDLLTTLGRDAMERLLREPFADWIARQEITL